MTDDKISSNQAIDAALQLDGDPEKIRAYYEDWAESYDLDVGSVEYAGPAIAAQLLKKHQTQVLHSDCRLLDAGCGTGLVGVELSRLGFEAVDGFDLSQAMADKATQTGCYREVRGGVEMMQAETVYTGRDYDAIICVGVFTLGHVPPEALRVLLALARAHALLVISTRSLYYRQSNFQAVVDELIGHRRIELLQLIENAPYNRDGDGHYWVFRKT